MRIKSKFYIKNVSFALNSYRASEFFDPLKLRRIDNLSKLALYACAKLFTDAGIDFEMEKDDIGLIVATGRGGILETCKFMDGIIYDGALCASPLAFCASVHNAIENAITTTLNFRGPCLTISQGASSFESALITSHRWLIQKRCHWVLLVVADEANPIILSEYPNRTIFNQNASCFLIGKNIDGAICHVKTIEQDPNAIADEFNPSLYAFNIARKISPLFSASDIKEIINDIIKTDLASKKIQVMSVFENQNNLSLLKTMDVAQKTSILKNIKDFFALKGEINEDIAEDFNFLAKKCSQSAQKDGIVFSTSGSLGEPKFCPHSKDMLKEEISGCSFLFKDIKRIISLAPFHHSYGFIFGLQTGKFLDIQTKKYAPMPNLPWDKILQDGDLFITFPLFLNYLKELDFKFPKGLTILTSTSPCPDSLMETIYQNGAERIIEIYGSSETGAIAYREKPKNAFKFLPFWKFVERNGFIETIFRDTQKDMELPDIIESLDGGDFFIKGRKDNAVQVAGINVYPSKIESILKNCDGIKDVSVRLGNKRLKAFIALKDGICETEIKKSLLDFMNKNLNAQEIPQNIVFGNTIPINHLGKKSDW